MPDDHILKVNKTTGNVKMSTERVRNILHNHLDMKAVRYVEGGFANPASKVAPKDCFN